MKIVLSTSNPNKVKEISSIVRDIEWIPRDLKVEEDGKTFEENAVKKAKTAYEFYGPAVADDSGLEIYALDNFPGVYSARFMEGADYFTKNSKILEMMKDIPGEKRGARFVCVAVYYDGTPHIFKGVVEGRIAFSIRGDGGFGYDPIFIPEGFDKTFGEMSSSQKDLISHRSRAFRKLSAFLHEKEKI